MTISDITAPLTEPISLNGAKEFLRVDHGHEDALITDMIRAARERIEVMARTSLITRRRAFTSSRLCATTLFINHSPIRFIHKVTLLDANDSVVDVPLSELFINRRASPVSIQARGRALLSDYAIDPVAIVVELDAGYGAEKETVPMQLRQAVLLLLAQHYEHRDDALTRPVPMLVDALLMPYRTVRL